MKVNQTNLNRAGTLKVCPVTGKRFVSENLVKVKSVCGENRLDFITCIEFFNEIKLKVDAVNFKLGTSGYVEIIK